MKKFVLISFVLLFILSGCRQNDLISAPIFISRFNKISDEKIDDKNICAAEEEDELVYNFLIKRIYLITLRTEKQSGRIKQCTVTSQNSKNLEEDDFFELCGQVVSAYGKIERKNAEEMLKDYSFKKPEKSSRSGFLRFDFTFNETAAFFSVESSRLNREKVTDKKLYEQPVN